MKKTILGILIVAISALLLAGCSLSYDGEESAPQKNSQEQETTKTESVNEKDGCLDDGLFY